MEQVTTTDHEHPKAVQATERLNRVQELYGTTCYLCGIKPGNTADHVLPRAKGGSDHIDNLRPCCLTCNQDKADRYLEEYVQLRGLELAEWPQRTQKCIAGWAMGMQPDPIGKTLTASVLRLCHRELALRNELAQLQPGTDAYTVAWKHWAKVVAKLHTLQSKDLVRMHEVLADERLHWEPVDA